MDICPKYWYDEQKTIPIKDLEDGYFECPKCNNKGIYDKKVIQNIEQRTKKCNILGGC